MPTDWQDYLDAARRKISIASFHVKGLDQSLAEKQPTDDGRPPIPVQAYFEGAIISIVAAIDQVAQAANSALSLSLDSARSFDGAFKAIEARVPEFQAWRENPIGIDLRRIRTRMVHYSYTKSAHGQPSWKVESANEKYEGSRELSDYAIAAVAYSKELEGLLGKLENALQIGNEKATN